MTRLVLCLFIAILALPLHAAQTVITGQVVGILDGDTLTVLTPALKPVRVRLSEIDAPEKAQAFGQRSRQSLNELCGGQLATVLVSGSDQHGRALGKVSCAGIEANTEQVRQRMAWVYDRYAHDQRLITIQEEARAAGTGLWRDSYPMPPWEFRRAHRDATVAK